MPPHRLRIGERAADSARDFVGSWPFLLLLALLVTAGIVVAVRHDTAAGPVAVLGLASSGLALVGLSLVLLAARRADRTAAQVALYDLESDRRRAAAVDELRNDVEQLRGDLARLVARLEASSSPPRRPEEVRR